MSSDTVQNNQQKGMRTYPIIGTVDAYIFWPSLIALLTILLMSIFFTKETGAVMSSIQNYFCMRWTWFINLLVGINFFYVLYIAMSKYGTFKLGNDDETPEYSNWSWLCMMFSAGVGIGFVCFGAAEPMWHSFTSTAVVANGTAGTPAAFPMGIHLSIMDWGPTAWALFSMGGLAIALPCYRRNLPMTVGCSLYGIMGDKCKTSIWSKLVDILGIIASVCGNSAALGMGVLSVCWVLNRIFGISISLTMQAAVMFCILLGYIISTATGLNRGLKYLSLGNVYVGMALCVFVLVVGPTTYIMNLMTEQVGMLISSLVPTAFFTDAGSLQQDEWIHWWPVFYWLWWVSYIPFVGGFMARISRGRSIRQFLLGSALAPVGMSIVWFTIFGGAASWAQFVDGIQIWEAMKLQGSEPAIYMVLESYPLGTLACLVAMTSLIIFTITTSDAASFYISLQVSGKSGGNAVLGARLLWSLVLGSFAVILIFLGGTDAMAALKGFTIAGAAPFCIILVLMQYSVWKMLKMIEQGKM